MSAAKKYPTLCRECGATIHKTDTVEGAIQVESRLCAKHLREARAAAPPFACRPADIDSGHDMSDDCPECLHPWAKHSKGGCLASTQSFVSSYGEVIHDGLTPRPCDCAEPGDRLTGEDRGVRCVVTVGWPKGLHGVIVGPATRARGEFFTVQLDNGTRFCALPGQVARP